MEIIVKSGLIPVHSLDLWGVIIDEVKMGENKLELFREVASGQGISDEEAAKRIEDYRGLMRGEEWARGPRKLDIIHGIQGTLDDAKVPLSYKGTFLEDGLYIVREILDCGEGFVIFTSGVQPGLKEQMPSDISAKMGEIHRGKKTDPNEFKRIYNLELGKNRHLVTHTADGIEELVAAKKSGVVQGLIYVNRNNVLSREDALAKGIHKYVEDLREIKYSQLVKKD